MLGSLLYVLLDNKIIVGIEFSTKTTDVHSVEATRIIYHIYFTNI